MLELYLNHKRNDIQKNFSIDLKELSNNEISDRKETFRVLSSTMRVMDRTVNLVYS